MLTSLFVYSNIVLGSNVIVIRVILGLIAISWHKEAGDCVDGPGGAVMSTAEVEDWLAKYLIRMESTRRICRYSTYIV